MVGPGQGYPRPKGATPLRVPLVPAYNQCTAPNRVHGPPLDSPSCSPPAQSSQHLTVGTPDANGRAAKSVGFVRLAVRPGDPGTRRERGRCRVQRRDHRRSRRSRPDRLHRRGRRSTPSVRITDRHNAVSPGGGTDAAHRGRHPVPVPTCRARRPPTRGRQHLRGGRRTFNAIVPGRDHGGQAGDLGARTRSQVFDGGSGRQCPRRFRTPASRSRASSFLDAASSRPLAGGVRPPL